jgi:hypothetical protein
MSACYKSCCAQGWETCGGCCNPAAPDNWSFDLRRRFIDEMKPLLQWPELGAHPRQRALEFHAWMFVTGGYADDGGPSDEDLVLLGAPCP